MGADVRAGSAGHDRLTAILAADVAGYSRLMGIDEHATVDNLDAVRSVFRREIEANDGRVVDMAGDSVLALFESAAGAVAAAISVQEKIEAAAATQPDDRRMRVRIGVHLGDVIVKADGTVYGNGVNIAARLQAIAGLGGVCISQTVYDTVKLKLKVEAQFAGPQAFKNIAEPVVAWHVATGAPASFGSRAASADASVLATSQPRAGTRPLVNRGLVAAAVSITALVAAGGGWWWSSLQPTEPAGAADLRSIAVLPFASMSDDRSNAHFADGMQEDLLTQLAQVGELKVVSRTSVAEYRSNRKNLRQVGAELGVGSVVEGSVRRAGDRVRVSVQLIDARTDRHIWARSYDRELKDVLAIQGELATEIARALKVSLTSRDEVRLARKPTDSLQAYELYRRFEESAGTTRSGPNLAMGTMDRIALLSRAVELDPSFGMAWARLANEHAKVRFWFLDQSDARLQMAQQAIDRALALAPDDLTVRAMSGGVSYFGYRDFQRAAQQYEDILKVVPHHVETLNNLASVRRREGRLPEAIALHERALAVDTRNLEALASLRDNFAAFRDFDRALALQKRILEIRPGDISAQAQLHYLEFVKTGSFATYDDWRATLPVGAEQESTWVWTMDLQRAWSRRDFDAASRLLETMRSDAYPLDIRGLPFVLLAKGERAKAMEVAGNLIRESAIALQRQPQPQRAHLMMRDAFARAILGERDAAHAEFRRAWASFYGRADLLDGDILARKKSHVHALLGEREETLRYLREGARRPRFEFIVASPHMWRSFPLYAKLWDDPEFKSLANDPAMNAPIPITNQEPVPVAPG